MSEEFIEDIIAANEPAASNEQDAAAEIAKAIDQPEAKVVASADLAVTNKSSSTPEDATVEKTTDVPSDSDGAIVAPVVAPEVEELASQLGWNKEHKGAEAVDAATYILRSKDIQKTMKDHNRDLKNQLAGLNGSIEALQEHNERVFKADVKKLQDELAGLKAEKKAAVELADVKKVEELDQQIDEVQKDINAPAKQVNKPTNNPAYDAWIGDNDWYLTDDVMAKYADIVAEQYAGAPPERIYALVRTKVAEVFPDKFAEQAPVAETPTLAEPAAKVVAPQSPVEGAVRTAEAGSFTKADLSADQQAIMAQFVRGGIMTEDQYVADIAKLQGA